MWEGTEKGRSVGGGRERRGWEGRGGKGGCGREGRVEKGGVYGGEEIVQGEEGETLEGII